MDQATLTATFAAMNSLHDIWRRDQKPLWESILLEAELTGDESRAEYARWILTEVLHYPQSSTESPSTKDGIAPDEGTPSVSQETEKGPAKLF